jgi:hypothetical protein
MSPSASVSRSLEDEAGAPAPRNRPVLAAVAPGVMVEASRSAPDPAPSPSGLDDLEVRERWLKRQRARSLVERRSGLIAVWVAIAALVSWLFIAGFAGLGH